MELYQGTLGLRQSGVGCCLDCNVSPITPHCLSHEYVFEIVYLGWTNLEKKTA